MDRVKYIYYSTLIFRECMQASEHLYSTFVCISLKGTATQLSEAIQAGKDS